MTITGLSQFSSRNPPRLEAVNTCPSNPVFNPLAIELKLYRRLRADETHTLTKFDDYPINTRGVRTMRGQVGPTESSVVDTCHPNFFFNLKAIELKLYRNVLAYQAHISTKIDDGAMNIKGVMTITGLSQFISRNPTRDGSTRNVAHMSIESCH